MCYKLDRRRFIVSTARVKRLPRKPIAAAIKNRFSAHIFFPRDFFRYAFHLKRYVYSFIRVPRRNGKTEHQPGRFMFSIRALLLPNVCVANYDPRVRRSSFVVFFLVLQRISIRRSVRLRYLLYLFCNVFVGSVRKCWPWLSGILKCQL